jgi:hypothetical protein
MSMVAETTPSYLDALEDTSEATIRTRMTELEDELKRLKESLEESRKSKQIMALSGPQLREGVLRFLSAGLSMPAQQGEGEHGAFWLVAEAVGEKWCFGEIRDSADGNVTREHLAHVMIDREASSMPETFPALLVVNTFFRKDSMDDRDQKVPGEVARRAAEDHILIVRTLDLIRLYQKEQAGFAGLQEFQAAVRTGGGWYEVNNSLASKVHTE